MNYCRKHFEAFKYRVLKKAMEYTDDDKRIVITSSTKSFAEDAYNILTKHFIGKQTDKVILLYHSESDEKVNRDNMEHLHKKWSSCDALIYSPTISVGVRFELPHFHHQISYMENSMYNPPVDCIIQQMFRVRQLIDGNMDTYV
jgi:hypothetical protein